MTRRDIDRLAMRIGIACALLALCRTPALPRHPMRAAAAPFRMAASPPLVSAQPAVVTHVPAPVVDAPTTMTLTDPFAATSWAPPAPAPAPATTRAEAAAPVVVAPPPPVAPPLPFVYVGRYVEGARQIVMLMKGEQLLLVQQGDTIDNLYRLERVAADRIELTYLPLGMRQSVRTFDSA
ncbi:hypothetical protein ACCD08_10840 [Telluria sp. Tellsp104]